MSWGVLFAGVIRWSTARDFYLFRDKISVAELYQNFINMIANEKITQTVRVGSFST